MHTLFGKPIIDCGNPDPHPWHGDGATYCLGGPVTLEEVDRV